MVIALNGGIRSPGLVIYIPLPILTSWLLSARAALWLTGLSLGTTIFFARLEIAGINLPQVIPLTAAAICIIFMQAILSGVVPVAYILRRLKVALTQSRQIQQDLRKYKKELEQVVEQRNAQLLEARDEALAANQAKSAFVANMSHELRTPLNAIPGFSAMVRMDETLPERHRGDLAVVGTSGKYLLDPIDDVLDIARIEAGSIRTEIAPFDLYALISATVEILRERAHAKRLELRSSIVHQSRQLFDRMRENFASWLRT